MTNKYKFTNIAQEDLAWLAGLFQGESYFYYDKRVRAKTSNEAYTPPPPTPIVRIEMIEKDLMEKVGKYVFKPVKVMKRKTTAGNTVYRVTICARAEVEAFLVAIQPYVIGDKTRDKIAEMLTVCNQYNNWVAAGGRNQAARIANKASQKARKNQK